MTRDEAMAELTQGGFDRVVPDGGAIIVITGEGRSSRAKRYESAEVAAIDLVVGPRTEARRKATNEGLREAQ